MRFAKLDPLRQFASPCETIEQNAARRSYSDSPKSHLDSFLHPNNINTKQQRLSRSLPFSFLEDKSFHSLLLLTPTELQQHQQLNQPQLSRKRFPTLTVPPSMDEMERFDEVHLTSEEREANRNPEVAVKCQ